MWKTLFLVASNLFLLIPIHWTLKRRLPFESFVLLSALVVSAFWHACSGSWNFCLLSSFSLHRDLDFIFAYYLPILISVYLVFSFNSRAKQFLLLVYGFAVILLVVAPATKATSQSVKALIVSGVALVNFFLFRRKQQKYDWIDGGIAILLVSLGVFLFIIDETVSYEILHSLWHVVISFAIYFALEAKNRRVFALCFHRRHHKETVKKEKFVFL